MGISTMAVSTPTLFDKFFSQDLSVFVFCCFLLGGGEKNAGKLQESSIKNHQGPQTISCLFFMSQIIITLTYCLLFGAGNKNGNKNSFHFICEHIHEWTLVKWRCQRLSPGVRVCHRVSGIVIGCHSLCHFGVTDQIRNAKQRNDFCLHLTRNVHICLASGFCQIGLFSYGHTPL